MKKKRPNLLSFYTLICLPAILLPFIDSALNEVMDAYFVSSFLVLYLFDDDVEDGNQCLNRISR